MNVQADQMYYMDLWDDVNGEDLNIQDLWVRNIDANSVTTEWLIDVNVIDMNVWNDANFQSIGVAQGAYLNRVNAVGDANFVDVSISGTLFGGSPVIIGTDVNIVGDINIYEAITAVNFFGDFFGDGSGLSGITGDGFTATLDINTAEQDWLFGLDLNYASVVDFNSQYASRFSPNFVGDSNFTNVQADYFYGDGSGITGVTATADLNGEDIAPKNVQVDNNLNVSGDSNFTNVQADYFYGDGSGITGVTAVADLNGEDIAPNRVDIDGNLDVGGKATFNDEVCFDSDCTTKIYYNSITGALRIDVIE